MRKTAFILPVLLCVFCAQFAFADEPTPLTNEQRDSIVMNCSSIKTNLSRIQKADSATRVHLGTTYQNISSRFLIPMNLRLVKNNQLGSDLNTNFNDFNTGRNNFNQNFINYSRELENLIGTDCKEKPDEFYQTLQKVRTLRSKVAEDASYLRWLLNNHLDSIKTLKKGEKDV